MSSQARILRRDFTGKLSLKITDHCRATSLLSKFSPSSTSVLPHGSKLENGLFLCELENVLSPQECVDIIKNGDECIFQDMSEKYRFGKQRSSSRLLALDKTLAGNLWQNIEVVLLKDMEKLKISKQPLGFDVTRGEWELHGLNEAMRISKYFGEKKEFFGPHKDAQYCPSGDERSLFTLLVYLNEDFLCGETCFYFPKDATQSTKGMTMREEIDALGGLKEGFTCVKIIPKIGHAVLFSQNIIHESLPIVKGTKYILKTDVVVKRHSKHFGFAVEDKEKEDYLTCLNYFREAQQQEMQGNFENASDLYERALSIRYCYPKSLETAENDALPSTRDCVKTAEKPGKYMWLPLEVWQHILNYLTGHDAQNLVYAYPEINVAKQNLERHEWNNVSSPSDQKYVPNIKYQKGIVTCFEFPDADFFKANASGCCRVAAMYSFFLLGHKPEDDVYIVRYNPDTQDVCAVALETLLTDVFYGQQCYGSFYSVHQQDPKVKDPKKDFEASVDRNYMLLRHEAEFTGVELPDSFYVKSTAYPHPDHHCDDEEQMKDEECKVEDGEEKAGVDDGSGDDDETSIKGQKELCNGFVPYYGEVSQHLRVDEVLRNYIRLEDINRWNTPETSISWNDLFQEEDFCSGETIFFNVLDDIIDSGDNVSCTLVSKLKKSLSIAFSTACVCGIGMEEELIQYIGESCTTEFYNHLVFDFQKSELSVQYYGTGADNRKRVERELLHPSHFENISEEQNSIGCVGEAMFYKVNIEPLLSSGTSFNHASCMCGNAYFEVHEYYNMKDYPYLSHINLVARELQGNMLVWTVYGGIVAL